MIVQGNSRFLEHFIGKQANRPSLPTEEKTIDQKISKKI
jgi:hypothetical protein